MPHSGHPGSRRVTQEGPGTVTPRFLSSPEPPVSQRRRVQVTRLPGRDIETFRRVMTQDDSHGYKTRLAIHNSRFLQSTEKYTKSNTQFNTSSFSFVGRLNLIRVNLIKINYRVETECSRKAFCVKAGTRRVRTPFLFGHEAHPRVVASLSKSSVVRWSTSYALVSS